MGAMDARLLFLLAVVALVVDGFLVWLGAISMPEGFAVQCFAFAAGWLAVILGPSRWP
jgi:hypothetical protein